MLLEITCFKIFICNMALKSTFLFSSTKVACDEIQNNWLGPWLHRGGVVLPSSNFIYDYNYCVCR